MTTYSTTGEASCYIRPVLLYAWKAPKETQNTINQYTSTRGPNVLTSFTICRGEACWGRGDQAAYCHTRRSGSPPFPRPKPIASQVLKLTSDDWEMVVLLPRAHIPGSAALFGCHDSATLDPRSLDHPRTYVGSSLRRWAGAPRTQRSRCIGCTGLAGACALRSASRCPSPERGPRRIPDGDLEAR